MFKTTFKIELCPPSFKALMRRLLSYKDKMVSPSDFYLCNENSWIDNQWHLSYWESCWTCEVSGAVITCEKFDGNHWTRIWMSAKWSLNKIWYVKWASVLFQLFWCWRWNISALEINTMSADALAPEVTRASPGIVLAVLDYLDRQHVLLFQS